jgi:hypothetical protein
VEAPGRPPRSLPLKSDPECTYGVGVGKGRGREEVKYKERKETLSFCQTPFHESVWHCSHRLEYSAPHSGRFTHAGMSPLLTEYSIRQGGPQSRSGGGREEKNPALTFGSSSVVQPVGVTLVTELSQHIRKG